MYLVSFPDHQWKWQSLTVFIKSGISKKVYNSNFLGEYIFHNKLDCEKLLFEIILSLLKAIFHWKSIHTIRSKIFLVLTNELKLLCYSKMSYQNKNVLIICSKKLLNLCTFVKVINCGDYVWLIGFYSSYVERFTNLPWGIVSMVSV